MEKFRITALETLNIPAGNDVALLVKLVKGFSSAVGNAAELVGEPFPVDLCEDVTVSLVSERGLVTEISPFTVGDGGRLLFTLLAKDVRVGLKYGIDVRGTLNDVPWHAFGKSVVSVTASTERGPESVVASGDPYEITLGVGYAADVVPRYLSELIDNVGFVKTEQLLNYVPKAAKGVAGGVASLNAKGKVPPAQLDMPWRGSFTGYIHETDIAAGIYELTGYTVGPNVVGGQPVTGIFVQYADKFHTQVLLCGGIPYWDGGTSNVYQRIYTRRYLPNFSTWTKWYSSDSGGGLKSVAWSELKQLRDSGRLTPGQQYRITDYVATTTQENTQSANRPFDIIVTADSPTKLSEWARACKHDFSDACDHCDHCDSCSDGGDPFWNSRLEAWLLLYSLDNDTSRFAWADEQNGKGVVYWMRDEWGNEMPFDFKGIQFYSLNPCHYLNGGGDYYYYYYYYYAFSTQRGGNYGRRDEEIYDASLDGTARRNVVRAWYDDGVQTLNNIIFFVADEFCSTVVPFGEILDNFFDYNCHDLIASKVIFAENGYTPIRFEAKDILVNRGYTCGASMSSKVVSSGRYGFPAEKDTTYTLSKSGTKIVLTGSDGNTSQVEDSDTKLTAMTQTEGNTGTGTTARSITPKVLKATILKHTEGKASADDLAALAERVTALENGGQ